MGCQVKMIPRIFRCGFATSSAISISTWGLLIRIAVVGSSLYVQGVATWAANMYHLGH